jgi:two-component system sensor histidine kinase YesM
LIQSQIKPHFLYNSLETIISLNKLCRYDDAISIAKSLANFYRSSLSKGGDLIRIAEEVSMTSNYLAIQKMRYSNYMEYSINIPDEIKDLAIPKLTLQPLVENSIYHGLKLKQGVGRLEISGRLTEAGDVCIEVYDNGAGIPQDKISMLLEKSVFNGKSEDFGLASVNNRIRLLYGSGYGIQIQSELGSFTKVILTIPATELKG